jgi:asparagine synthase (glutamine-hydrolysing)
MSITHASGRPWLVGSWPEHQLRLVSAGTSRLAVLGHTRLDPASASRALDRARSPYDLDRLARELPGGCHLFASVAGHTRSQGTVSGSRQIFYTTVDGTAVAATSPESLVALTGARLDEQALALRLLTPVAPWPLSLRSVWSGVRQLPGGHWLHLDPGGHPRPVSWWSPPEPDRPLAEAATAIRAALRESVAVRVGGCEVVSADLSGGLDSTCLCFLAAAATGGTLLTYHWTPLDRANDDSRWADRAAVLLPGDHRPVSVDHEPQFDGGPEGTEPTADVEGPPPWNRGRAHHAALSRAVAAAGSRLHLVGLGGDDLFGAVPAYLWSLVRRNPIAGLRTARRGWVLNRWSLRATLRGLADRRPYPTWLADQAEQVTAPAPARSDPSLGWAARPRLPAWATPDAVEAVRRAIREAAGGDPRPLAGDRYRHQVLEGVQAGGRAVRQLESALRRFGVGWEAPYLDDRVVEAALSVRLPDRLAAGEYKPVLRAAMRGVVPEPVLARRSKGEYSAEAYDGLRRDRRALVDYCDDLRLAGLGLVDAAALRAALLRPSPETRHLMPFENTLSCEAWLRSRALIEVMA